MNYRKIIAVIAAMCISFTVLPMTVAYNSDTPSVYAEDSDVSGTIELVNVGSSRQITFTNTTESPTWYSDNESVATVSSDGTVTAAGEGTAYIYAVFSSQVLKFKVVVTVEETTEVTEVVLGNAALSNEQPTAEVALTGVSASDAVWSSSDTSVATVDNTGVITAVGPGSCTITALINGISYIVNVTSTYTPEEPVTEVILGSVTLTEENNAYQIKLSNVPEDAQVIWSSTDESVATVDQNGVIVAEGKGSCQVIALINGVSYITNVTSEYEWIPETGETIIGSMELTNETPSAAISLSGVPEGAQITWSSSDESIATVDQNGLVTAVSSGSCRIIIDVNGQICYMLVTSTYTPDEEITIDGGEFLINGIGNKLQLTVNNSDEKPSWMSMNVNVATVDENGLVTAVGEGEAVIIAQFSNTICQVTVTVTDDSLIYGDANDNGVVEVADAVYILQGIADPSNVDFKLTEAGSKQANCNAPDSSGIDAQDALAIQMYMADMTPSLPV